MSAIEQAFVDARARIAASIDEAFAREQKAIHALAVVNHRGIGQVVRHAARRIAARYF